MTAAIKPYLMIQTFSLALLIACSGYLQAAPSSQSDDFYHNCDIRQLNLSQEQQNALRRIRTEYRSAADKAYQKSIRSDRTRRQNIIKILSMETFDQNSARDYVESRYLANMDFGVDELAIQHQFYRLLSPLQRQQWLATCLR